MSKPSKATPKPSKDSSDPAADLVRKAETDPRIKAALLAAVKKGQQRQRAH